MCRQSQMIKSEKGCVEEVGWMDGSNKGKQDFQPGDRVHVLCQTSVDSRISLAVFGVVVA